MSNDDKTAEQRLNERYIAAAHKMQSGVALKINYDRSETSPKHLRVGVNAAMVDAGALAELLVLKGIITHEEYLDAIARMMEHEAKKYEEWAQKNIGPNVKLG